MSECASADIVSLSHSGFPRVAIKACIGWLAGWLLTWSELISVVLINYLG